MTLKITKYALLTLFTAFALLSLYYAFEFGRADILAYHLFLLMFFFIARELHGKFGDKTTVLAWHFLVPAGIILSATGIYGIFTNPGARPSGLLGDRVFEADAVTGILLFIFGYFLTAPKNAVRDTISLSTTFIISVYLILLRVRTSYAAIIISFSVLIFLYFYHRKNQADGKSKERRSRLTFIAAVMLSAVLLPVFLPAPEYWADKNTVTPISDTFNKDIDANKARIKFWSTSLKMFFEKPVTGIGAGLWSGTYPKYHGDFYNDAAVDINSPLNPHNDYLEFLSEYGISGIFYSLFVFTGFIYLVFELKKNEKAIPLIAVCAGYAVTSFLNFTKDNVAAEMLFLFCLSAGYASVNRPWLFTNKLKTAGLLLVFIAATSVLIYGVFEKQVYIRAMKSKVSGKNQEMLSLLKSISRIIYPVDMNKMPLDYYMGAGYYEAGDYSNALICSGKAKIFMPYYPTVVSNYASALYAAGKKNEAILTLQETGRGFPNFIEPQINLLSMYANTGMDNEAINLIEKLEKKINVPNNIKNYIVFLDIKNYYLKKGL